MCKLFVPTNLLTASAQAQAKQHLQPSINGCGHGGGGGGPHRQNREPPAWDDGRLGGDEGEFASQAAQVQVPPVSKLQVNCLIGRTRLALFSTSIAPHSPSKKSILTTSNSPSLISQKTTRFSKIIPSLESSLEALRNSICLMYTIYHPPLPA